MCWCSPLSDSVPPRGLRPAGWTLVELLVVLAVLGLLLAGSVPGLADALERRRTAALSQQVLALLQQARLEAQSRNQALRVAVRPAPAGGPCLLLHTGGAQACGCDASAGTCTGSAVVLQQVQSSAAPGPSLFANVPSLRFDPSLGTTTPAGRVVLRSRLGEVHHVVSATGRVRRCAVPGADGGLPLAGLPGC